ncbi:hypothetical protein HK104_009626, partial [Borealophlyctis nickersoniae]
MTTPGTLCKRRSMFSLTRTLSRFSGRSQLSSSAFSARRKANLARFGKSKVAFLVFNTGFTLAGLSLSLFTLFTWLSTYTLAPLIRLLHPPLLIGITIIGFAMTLIGLLGYLGAFAHKKAALGVYGVVIWPVVIGTIVVGYGAYKVVNDGRWNQELSGAWDGFGDGRGVVQTK